MEVLLLVLAGFGLAVTAVFGAIVAFALITGGVASALAVGAGFVKVIQALVEHAKIVRRKRRERWKQFADAHGLVVNRAGEVAGSVDGFKVGLHTYTERRGDHRVTYLVLDLQTGIRGVELRKEASLAGFFQGLFGEDVQIGDTAFDSHVHVAGDEGAARALLDAGMRQHVRTLLSKGRARLDSDGTIRIFAESIDSDPEPMLQRALDFARQLRTAQGARDQRLGDIVSHDPKGGVRAEALAFLMTRNEDGLSGHVQVLAQDALADSDPAVRLVAASALGAAPVLAELVRDSRLSQRIRSRAAEALAGNPDVGLARTVLVELLSQPTQRLQVLAIRRLRDEDLLDESAQAPLLALIDSEPESLAMAAIRALGDAGDSRAVEPLMELAQHSGMLSRVPGAARGAIRSIQSRLGDVDRGGLSIAEVGSEGGALSIAEPSAAGQLSLSAKK